MPVSLSRNGSSPKQEPLLTMIQSCGTSPDPPDKQTTKQMHNDLFVSNVYFRFFQALVGEFQSSKRPSHGKRLLLFLVFLSPSIELSMCFVLYKLNSLGPEPGLGDVALLVRGLPGMHEALGFTFRTMYAGHDSRRLYSQHMGDGERMVRNARSSLTVEECEANLTVLLSSLHQV